LRCGGDRICAFQNITLLKAVGLMNRDRDMAGKEKAPEGAVLVLV
jgi:hypothetical protein